MCDGGYSEVITFWLEWWRDLIGAGSQATAPPPRPALSLYTYMYVSIYIYIICVCAYVRTLEVWDGMGVMAE